MDSKLKEVYIDKNKSKKQKKQIKKTAIDLKLTKEEI